MTGTSMIGLALLASSAAAELYCPTKNDMNLEHGNVTFSQNGWAHDGDARVSSKTSWNLLGGYIEFDMDVSGVAAEVNTNLYTVSMDKPNCGEDCYCDIQKSKSGKPSCMEMDIIEANGQCAMATTIHTFETDGVPNNSNCDRWGCGATATLPSDSKKFHIKASFGADGTLTVLLNGSPNAQYSPSPSTQSNAVVVKTMQSVGAAIESSQWFGWAPAQGQCPTGDKSGLDASHVEISNVQVSGTVVQGPGATKCSGPAPAPTPPPPPAPTPPPTPPPTPGSSAKTCPSCSGGACDCSWVQATTCQGPGDGSCCFKCCCGQS